MARRANPASVLLLALALGACAGSPPAPSRLADEALGFNQRAARAYERGDFAQARSLYERALEIDAGIDHADGVAMNSLSLARVNQALGEADAAHRHLDRVLDSAAAAAWRAEAAGRKAQLHLAAGELARAEEWIGRAQDLCGQCRAQAASAAAAGERRDARGTCQRAAHHRRSENSAAAARIADDRQPASRGAMTREKARFLAAFALVLGAGLAAQYGGLAERADRALLDAEFRQLRERAPQPVDRDVVVVGIDETTFQVLREPFALWHPHLGRFLQAMAIAKPSVLGLDIALPDRSYHFLLPNYDQPLVQGLADLRGGAQVPIVLAQSLDERGNLRAIFPPYLAVAGKDASRNGAATSTTRSAIRSNTSRCSRCSNGSASGRARAWRTRSAAGRCWSA